MTEPAVMVISGTSRGIGLGLAQHYIKQGLRVAGCSRGPTNLVGENYLHSTVDLADAKQIASWIRAVKRHYGRLDFMVCNAGLVPPSTLLTTTPIEVIDEVLSVNVRGTFILCREAAKAMLVQRAGRIVTFSSMAAGMHEPGTSAYAASKCAIVEMTRVLANELAPVGITCNVIAPSVFKESAEANLGAKVVGHALERLTIKRELTIEEICNVVDFFMAPESRCITGQVISMGLI